MGSKKSKKQTKSIYQLAVEISDKQNKSKQAKKKKPPIVPLPPIPPMHELRNDGPSSMPPNARWNRDVLIDGGGAAWRRAQRARRRNQID